MRVGHWALFSRERIPDLDNPGTIYLDRVKLISTPWFGVYLHQIREPDWTRDLHDHPWSFVSLIVKGGYTEHKLEHTGSPLERVLHHRRGSVHRMARGQFHAITHLDHDRPCWTLVLCGPRRQGWGFLTPGGWESWETYVAERSAA